MFTSLFDKVPSKIDFIAVIGSIKRRIVFNLNKTPRKIGIIYGRGFLIIGGFK